MVISNIRKSQISVLLIIFAFCFASCNDVFELDKGLEDFKVFHPKSVYKVGEEIEFSFEGNPNFVTFYSGEVGKDFDYKINRYATVTGEMDLSFRSNRMDGNQENQISVFISKDFNGNYDDYSSVEAAEWIDVTDGFNLATSSTYLDSGKKDISDLFDESYEDPFYFAFRYTVFPSNTFGVGYKWNIQAILLEAMTTYGKLPIGDMGSIGFNLVEQNPSSDPENLRSAAYQNVLSFVPRPDLTNRIDTTSDG